MIPIFDLDDTLYPEINFVQSGFCAVAKELEKIYQWPVEDSMTIMNEVLVSQGRGAVFDRLLEVHKQINKANIKRCIDIYRHHVPKIELPKSTKEVLLGLHRKPYLVTDGHKVVQANKVKALNLDKYFKKIYLTNRYGIKNAKPSLHCFDLIRKQEKCRWEDMYYVGDNPDKDFVNLNKVGVITIRIKAGVHSNKIAKDGFEARYIIDALSDLKKLEEFKIE